MGERVPHWPWDGLSLRTWDSLIRGPALRWAGRTAWTSSADDSSGDPDKERKARRPWLTTRFPGTGTLDEHSPPPLLPLLLVPARAGPPTPALRSA
eukprot:scaffold31844_cov27-Tisochrysis_lutea.AAC.2